MSGTPDMPYGGNLQGRGVRFAWARLNADAMFLGLLAFLAGLFDLLDPATSDLVRSLGGTTPSFYLRAGGYVVAGAMLLLALARQSVPLEVLARVLLTTACLFELVRTWFVWHEVDRLAEPAALATILALTTGARLSVLLSRKGLVVHLPERRLGRHGGERE